jgi:hypothetical protein
MPFKEGESYKNFFVYGRYFFEITDERAVKNMAVPKA